MIKKIHGIDRHKKYSTISVLNREGQEIEFQRNCYDLKGYINSLGPEDAVVRYCQVLWMRKSASFFETSCRLF